MRTHTIAGMVLVGLAGFTLVAKDAVVNTGAAVDTRTTVIDVREAPAGDALPGLHFDAKIKGRVVDIYVAPKDFVQKYDVKVAKGQEIHVIGTEAKAGDADVVLTREITTGAVDKRTGIFHENMTIYLRNDEGPLW